MDNPPKTISDQAFAAHVRTEQRLLAQQDPLSAAELAGVRELLGFTDVLRPFVEDERFKKHAWLRVGGVRDALKAWGLAIGALIGLGVSIATAVKTFAG